MVWPQNRGASTRRQTTHECPGIHKRIQVNGRRSIESLKHCTQHAQPRKDFEMMRNKIRSTLLLSLLSLSGTVGLHQLPATFAGERAQSSPEQAVRLDVLVVDSDNRPITGLTSVNFHISEEGIPQTISR